MGQGNIDGEAAEPDRLQELDARLHRLEMQAPQRGSALDRTLRYLPLLALGNLFIAMPAVLISLAVAYFTFVQAEATEKMQIASVWPRLDYGTGNLDDEGRPLIKFTVANDGVGPARVGGMEVSYRGRKYLEADSLLQDCCSADERELKLVTSTINGSVIRPGFEVDFMQLAREGERDRVFAKLNAERFEIRVKLCFCSVFDECWIQDSRKLGAESVQQCPVGWAQYGLPPGSPPPG